MFKNLLIIFTLVLMGCGKAPAGNIDSAFLPYVHRFEALSAQYGKYYTASDLDIVFDSNMKSEAIGLCFEENGKGHKITIKPSFWAKASHIRKEVLIFHELGHCLMDKRHNDKKILAVDAKDSGRTIEVSLMNPYLLSDLTYGTNWNNYIVELFTGKEPTQLFLFKETQEWENVYD